VPISQEWREGIVPLPPSFSIDSAPLLTSSIAEGSSQGRLLSRCEKPPFIKRESAGPFPLRHSEESEPVAGRRRFRSPPFFPSPQHARGGSSFPSTPSPKHVPPMVDRLPPSPFPRRSQCQLWRTLSSLPARPSIKIYEIAVLLLDRQSVRHAALFPPFFSSAASC